MFADNDAIATIAVKDAKTAGKFYEETLGFTPGHSEEGMALTYQSGKTKLLVYQSQYAATNQATSATWAVDDVEAVVNELKAKGVTFEHYDFPGVTREGDIHISGQRKNAWFKDPDGNILGIVNK